MKHPSLNIDNEIRICSKHGEVTDWITFSNLSVLPICGICFYEFLRDGGCKGVTIQNKKEE